MLKAVFPGSFDPPTNGHLDILERAYCLFDYIYVVISVNRQKKYLFSPEERLEMMRELVKDKKNVEVVLWDQLIVDFAKKNDAKVLVRGVRALADFNYEFELSMMNKSLNPDIETIFLPTDPKYFVLRSSSIKELAALKGNISLMVPVIVEKALEGKRENL